MLAVYKRQIHHFTQSEVDVLTAIAAQAGVAISNARLFEAVARGKAEWEATFDAITDPLAIHSSDGRIHKANRAFAELFGKTPEGIVGQTCHQLFYRRSHPCNPCHLRETVQGRRPIAFEFERNGRAFLASSYPIFGKNGRVEMVVVHSKDITALKQTQEKLVRSAKLAAIGELAAGIAHNFNNLLAGVKGAVELLRMQAQKEGLSAKVQERLRSIDERLMQGDETIRRLLSFARGSADRSRIVKVEKAIQNALGVCETHPSGKGLRLVTEIAPNLPPVRGIASHLEQVLVNLIINAFQASEPGGEIKILAYRAPFGNAAHRGAGYGLRNRPGRSAPHLRSVFLQAP